MGRKEIVHILPKTEKYNHKAAHITAKNPKEKTFKKTPDNLYQEMLTFTGNIEISLLKTQTYEVSASPLLNSSCILQSFFVFDTGVASNPLQADLPDAGWMYSTRHHYRPQIRSASDAKLTISENITHHLNNGELCTCITIATVIG